VRKEGRKARSGLGREMGRRVREMGRGKEKKGRGREGKLGRFGLKAKEKEKSLFIFLKQFNSFNLNSNTRIQI